MTEAMRDCSARTVDWQAISVANISTDRLHDTQPEVLTRPAPNFKAFREMVSRNSYEFKERSFTGWL
jgi:hypothetical protein